MIPRPIGLRLLTHCERRAASRAACTAGSKSAISTAMIAMTTKSSMRVKPAWDRDRMGIPFPVESAGGRPKYGREHSRHDEARSESKNARRYSTFKRRSAFRSGTEGGRAAESLRLRSIGTDKRFEYEIPMKKNGTRQ